uniref:Reverse transcriptase domain-containing protein n=1 Tax=Nothobranchius furzeri TaxID=105023 RepID=A0A8C6Q7A5_NOTFU
MNSFSLVDVFQSGFRPLHSTESALLRVTNDILVASDSGSPVLLLLLDLSAAFDSVDHDILLDRLESWVGLRGTSLQWFCSYLSNRVFKVQLGNCSSTFLPLPWGVPQGSVLGPLLFSIYILPLGFILRKYGLGYHIYADDCQIYLALNKPGSLSLLDQCLAEVRVWLANNFLKLNDSNSEALLMTPNKTTHVSSDLATLPYDLKLCVTNLGVKLDTHFSMGCQINAVVRSCFYKLRLKPILKGAHLESVIHAFIISRLDYANSILIGLPASALNRLQVVQNAAARFLTNTPRRDHITPVLARLHWLPVNFRVKFKILTFVFKALNGLAPDYLSDLVTRYVPNRALTSADCLLLLVPSMKCKMRGQRAFVYAAPTLWNALPLSVRLALPLSVRLATSRLWFKLLRLTFTTRHF